MDATTSSSQLRRLDRLAWAVIAAAAVTVLVAPAFSTFYIVWWSFGPAVLCALGLSAGAWFYRNKRCDPKLASGLDCTAQLIAFAAVGAPLSYLAVAAGSGLPLQDPMLDAADRALGFNWIVLHRMLAETPWLMAGLRLAYGSLLPQMAFAVLCLAFTSRLLRLRVYMLAFLMTTIVTIAISAVLPAEGVWLHYGLGQTETIPVPVVSTVWPVFNGLRDGSVRALIGLGAEGVITFPSLHAALAMLLIVALWPVRFARWVVLPVNIAMLAATPIDGAHYVVDVLAGLTVALGSLAAAALLATRWQLHSASGFAVSRTPQLAARD